MNSRQFSAVLVGVAVVPVALAIGWVTGQRNDPPPKPHGRVIDWIYGPVQQFNTGQKGVIVRCQSRTNSRPFAERKHAKPGDVIISTCRAIKAP